MREGAYDERAERNGGFSEAKHLLPITQRLSCKLNGPRPHRRNQNSPEVDLKNFEREALCLESKSCVEACNFRKSMSGYDD